MKLKLFLATALLVTAAAVTASADAPTVSTPTSDGFGEISTTEADSRTMMAVNAGDTIKFTVAGATGDVTLLSAKAESEITGSGSFAFGVTVYDIPDEKTINEFKVEPFVTYKADTTSSEG